MKVAEFFCHHIPLRGRAFRELQVLYSLLLSSRCCNPAQFSSLALAGASTTTPAVVEGPELVNGSVTAGSAMAASEQEEGGSLLMSPVAALERGAEVSGNGNSAAHTGSVDTSQEEKSSVVGIRICDERSNGDATCSKRLKVEENMRSLTHRSHIEAAWEHWRKLGSPKLLVAPMVDQSELPFRLLCRKYGATAAYTPMFHSRLFAENLKYRKEFTTCPEDRPLFVQFCANNPDTLLEASRLVEDQCDYIDINFGCPQRIAKRGNYGAFLMDDLPLVRSLVSKLASSLSTPVSCKIRMFPKLEETLAYALMLEQAGCSLLAIHGRTRDQKDSKAIRADWDVIKAVKSVLQIPVLANGNIRWLEDVYDCIAATGVDGVLSAESLLENPALFSGRHMQSLGMDSEGDGPLLSEHKLNEPALLLEYLELCEKYPVPLRMIRAHVHRMLGPWFRKHPDLREELNKQYRVSLDWLKDMVYQLMAREMPLPPLKLEDRIELAVEALPSETPLLEASRG